MKRSIPFFLLVLILQYCSGPKSEFPAINYPTPFPENSAQTFLPEIVSTDAREFGSCFSRDGKTFYFCRTGDKNSGIYYTSWNGQQWTPSQPLLADSAWSNADPAFGPDGRLYFISNRPRDAADTLKDYDIWYTAQMQTDNWIAPVNFSAVNTDSSEYYVSFDDKGNLYFASNRAGSLGEEDIYVSKLENNQYNAPENLGPSVNTNHSEYDPGISPDGNMVVFASTNRDDSFGGADLYFSLRTDNKWNPSVHLDSMVNTPAREFCPYFSLDKKYFFYSSDNDVKWISRKGWRQEQMDGNQ